MAKTPYKDLSSQDILSAHISGIQHDVNKLQEILNLQTSSEVSHVMNPVNDQDDPALRYRIYEGTIRNWRENPLPVIYRNGSVVDNQEYTLQAPYGAIVFKEQQNSNDAITADFDYINNNSKTVSDMKKNIDTNTNSIGNINNEIDNLSFGQATRQFVASGMYASHNKDGYTPLATNVAVAASLVDAFPFPVGHTMTLDYMAVKIDTVAGTKFVLAIYKDSGGYPGELVIDAGETASTTAGWKYVPITVTLEPGMYWLVRNQDGAIGFSGFAYQDVLPIGFKVDSIPTESSVEDGTANMRDAGFFGGLRGSSTAGLNGFPQTFPTGIAPFSRAYYASIFVRKA